MLRFIKCRNTILFHYLFLSHTSFLWVCCWPNCRLINLRVSCAVKDKSAAPHCSLVNHRNSSPWVQLEWDVPSEVISVEAHMPSSVKLEDRGWMRTNAINIWRVITSNISNSKPLLTFLTVLLLVFAICILTQHCLLDLKPSKMRSVYIDLSRPY